MIFAYAMVSRDLSLLVPFPSPEVGPLWVDTDEAG